MTRGNRTAAGLLALVLIGGVLPAVGSAQDVSERPRRSSQAYDRSYEIGFDEGYRTGYDRGQEDFRDGRRRDVGVFREYRKGDIGYNDQIGNREEYRNGYRAGFTKGYDDGGADRAFGYRPGDTRVVVSQDSSGQVLRRGSGRTYDPPTQSDPNGAPADQGPHYGSKRVSYDTALVIELDTPISTKYTRAGDRFTARVVDSGPYAGARIDGYVGQITEPGRVEGAGEIVLVFERIIFPDGYSEPLVAQVEEIIGYPGGRYPKAGKNGPLNKAPWEWGKKEDRNDDIDGRVDDEGRIEGEGSRKKDVATVGAGAAAGAILGGILGGGSGAAIGAAVGAATGGGVVAATKGDQIELEPGCQLRIRTGKSPRL